MVQLRKGSLVQQLTEHWMEISGSSSRRPPLVLVMLQAQCSWLEALEVNYKVLEYSDALIPLPQVLQQEKPWKRNRSPPAHN